MSRAGARCCVARHTHEKGCQEGIGTMEQCEKKTCIQRLRKQGEITIESKRKKEDEDHLESQGKRRLSDVILDWECSKCTAGLDPDPIGNSISQLQVNTPQTLTYEESVFSNLNHVGIQEGTKFLGNEEHQGKLGLWMSRRPSLRGSVENAPQKSKDPRSKTVKVSLNARHMTWGTRQPRMNKEHEVIKGLGQGTRWNDRGRSRTRKYPRLNQESEAYVRGPSKVSEESIKGLENLANYLEEDISAKGYNQGPKEGRPSMKADVVLWETGEMIEPEAGSTESRYRKKGGTSNDREKMIEPGMTINEPGHPDLDFMHPKGDPKHREMYKDHSGPRHTNLVQHEHDSQLGLPSRAPGPGYHLDHIINEPEHHEIDPEYPEQFEDHYGPIHTKVDHLGPKNQSGLLSWVSIPGPPRRARDPVSHTNPCSLQIWVLPQGCKRKGAWTTASDAPAEDSKDESDSSDMPLSSLGPMGNRKWSQALYAETHQVCIHFGAHSA